jgi:hypothetical protein
LIFWPIVQERGDRLILIAAMLNDERGHGHQMRNVGDRRALARLLAMQVVGVAKGVVEALRKNGLVHHFFASSPTMGRRPVGKVSGV